MDIVLASGNQGKLRELSELLAPAQLNLIAQSTKGISSADETGLSFIENAILKARHAAKESGLPALSDDSGLSVDALAGAPGIYSARYAGEGASDQDNIDQLMRALEGLPLEKRTARFHCVLAFMRHAEDPTPLVCHGQWEGKIALEQSGSEGFGYDPVFYLDDLKCTAAELSRAEKSKVSHRGKALALLAKQLHMLKASNA